MICSVKLLTTTLTTRADPPQKLKSAFKGVVMCFVFNSFNDGGFSLVGGVLEPDVGAEGLCSAYFKLLVVSLSLKVLMHLNESSF